MQDRGHQEIMRSPEPRPSPETISPINNQVLELFLAATVNENIYRAGFQILRARLKKALLEGKIKDQNKAQKILDKLNKSFQKLTGKTQDGKNQEGEQDEFKEKLEKMKDSKSPIMQALAYDIEVHALQEQEQTIREQIQETTDEGYKNELNQQLESITDRINQLRSVRTTIKDGQEEIPDQVQEVLVLQIKRMAQVIKQIAVDYDLTQIKQQNKENQELRNLSAQDVDLSPEEIAEIEKNPISSFISTLYQILDQSLRKGGDQVFDKNSFNEEKFNKILKALIDEKVIDEDGSRIIENHLKSSFKVLQKLSDEEKKEILLLRGEKIVKKIGNWLFIGGGLILLYMYLARKKNQNQG